MTMVNALMKQFPVTVRPGVPFNGTLKGFADPIIARATNDGKFIDTDITRLHIIQIGAGGTGGYVAVEILRMLGSLPEAIKDNVHYTLMDGDKFEPKNLGRQLCTEEDMGEYKAQTLISVYGEAFGCRLDRVKAYNDYLTSIEQLEELEWGGLPRVVERAVSIRMKDGAPYTGKIAVNEEIRTNGNRPKGCNNVEVIVIDCVDKTTPRLIIKEYLDKLKNLRSDNVDAAKYFLAETNQKVEVRRGLVVPTTMCDVPSYVHTNNSYVKDIYLISSGNAQYTGQVGWGRVSFTDGTEVVKYSSYFGDDDQTSLFGAPVKDTIKLGDRVFINTEDDNKAIQNAFLTDSMKLYLDRCVYHKFLDHDRSENEVHNVQLSLQENSMAIMNVSCCTPFAATLQVKHKENGIPYFELMPWYKNVTKNQLIGQIVSVPTPYDVYPELTDVEIDKREEQMSCAERAAQNVQNINANKTAAMLVINFFTQILNGIYLFENEDSPRLLVNASVSFDIRTNSFKAQPITSDFLRGEF